MPTRISSSFPSGSKMLQVYKCPQYCTVSPQYFQSILWVVTSPYCCPRLQGTGDHRLQLNQLLAAKWHRLGGSTHPRHLNRASHHPKISQIWMKIPLNQIQIVSLRSPVPNLKNRNQPWHRLFNLDDLGVPYGVPPSDSHGSSWGDIRSSWCGVKLLALARDLWLMLLLKDDWKSQVSLLIIMKH